MPTLFLDRDGVVNERMPGEYVKNPDEFILVAGFEEAIRLLSDYFERIIVVTNQAGIGKGLMTLDDLTAVHQKMLDLTEAAGGRIDGIYFCPHRSDAACPCRKPATGMAWLALADFPDIELTDAWIAGDSISDMAFGQALGLRTVLIHGKSEEAKILSGMKLDHRFDALLEFARFIRLS